jgi:uncharacterized membrane protein
MTTPIILTVLLLTPLVVGRVWSAVTGKQRPSLAASAAIGLAMVFAFTGMGHFVKSEGMVDMLPPWFPMRHLAVLASGIFEWALAVALLVPRSRRMAALTATAFLIALLPINIWAAINRTGLGGHQWGPVYLWIRVPLQGLLIMWAILASKNMGATFTIVELDHMGDPRGQRHGCHVQDVE